MLDDGMIIKLVTFPSVLYQEVYLRGTINYAIGIGEMIDILKTCRMWDVFECNQFYDVVHR